MPWKEQRQAPTSRPSLLVHRRLEQSLRLTVDVVPWYQRTMVRPVVMLQWTMSLVLVLASVAALLQRDTWSTMHPGVATWVIGTVASAELVAIVLFLLPGTLRAGAALLVGVLAAAAAVYLWAGKAPPPSFLVYAAAIWVVVKDAPATRGYR